jgi:mono/diheme cytochrome c family protein
MKRLVFYALGVVGLLGLTAAAFFLLKFPAVGPAPQVSVEVSPARVARGRYLAENVAICMDCHSHRDPERFAGPVLSGTEGAGGEVFDHSMGLPGIVVAPNITPHALGGWTDGEIIRAMTEGVSRDGRALFPLMPYPAYRTMSQEDLYSIVAYLRTLKSIPAEHPETRLDFPVNLLVRTLPQPAQPEPTPDPADLIESGRYLATIGACADCHSPLAGGALDESRLYHGGREFPVAGTILVTPNLTPDPETGLGHWTEEQFVARFKMYDGEEGRNLSPEDAGFNTLMPWTMYAGMEEQDLKAIYAYLRTLTPVRAAHPRPGD